MVGSSLGCAATEGVLGNVEAFGFGIEFVLDDSLEAWGVLVFFFQEMKAYQQCCRSNIGSIGSANCKILSCIML